MNYKSPEDDPSVIETSSEYEEYLLLGYDAM
jgi:hypothetical protein